jgi:Glycosyl transferase family 2
LVKLTLNEVIKEVQMVNTLITVVVSTHNRPDALFYALSSLVKQSMSNWVAWVIGDCCDHRTAEVIAQIADERIKYINLPSRCGDQSGPNNIGASLCKTPFLAFLNHDDLLVQDHFEIALQTLERTKVDFFMGCRLIARNQIDSEQTKEYVFHHRPLAKGFWNAFVYYTCFEPVSSWVMRSEKYHQVGDWNDGFSLYRPPIADWLLRAYGCDVQFTNGTVPSVVHVVCYDFANNPQAQTQPGYQHSTQIIAEIWERLNSTTPNEFRQQISTRASSDLQFRVKSLTFKKAWNYALVLPARVAGTLLFRFTKLDALVLTKRFFKQQPGDWKRNMLRVRTGDAIQTPVDLEALKQYAKRQAGLDG